MKKFRCIGYPDEENAHSNFHTKREEIIILANDENEAMRKARDKFWYFHEIGVYEEK